MRKLNGITINGEYLGNSVVINGMFRAICTISPVIMRDFVQIINKIDKLEDAVKIHNFNCGFDSIDIEFENTTSKGIASLYFKIKNGEPELTDCKLVIDNQVYSTRDEKISLKTNATSPNTQPALTDAEERRNKIREIREKKIQQLKQNEQARKQQGIPPSPSHATRPPEMSKPLTPEEQRMRKRQELIEKKRRAMEARANKQAGGGEAGMSADNAAQGSAAQGGVASGIAAEGNNSLQDSVSNAGNSLNNDNIQNKNDSSYTENKQGAGSEAVSAMGEEGSSQSNVSQNPDGTSDDYLSENGMMNEEYSDSGTPIRSLDDLTDEDLENMSDEELAALEAELNAELGEDADSGAGYSDDYYSGSSYPNQDFNMMSFAEKLANGLTEGLTQGLSQGLAQGLSQGFGGLGGNGGGFGGGAGGLAGNAGGFDFSSNAQQSGTQFSNASPQFVQPDYAGIDNRNLDDAMNAKDLYSYDENSDLDDLSDLYSDFYEESVVHEDEEEGTAIIAQSSGYEPVTSEVDALKAELEALKAETAPKKDLMSLDEFLSRQRELEEAREKKRRQKIRIVGSRERVNASALEGGVFVSGNKVYKWGDTKVLD